VWGYAPTSQTRAVDTTMARLRRKVERDPSDPDHLLSVTGVGYRFTGASIARTAEQVAPVSPVPHYHDGFVGRRQLLSSLEEATAPGHLVTLVGVAGMGKSRLAAEFARGREVRWVGLADAASPSALVSRVADAVGVLPPADDSGLHLLLASASDALWVFDDADGVLRALAAHLPEWRRRMPAASWLVTSRRSLSLRAERVVPVGPLDEADALALFDDRCETPEPDPATGELVAALGGHPLAIELAAARARTLGAATLLRRSPAWLDLLSDRRGWRPERHASLRAALSGSWEAPPEYARELWLRLCELSCAIDVDVLEAIAGLDGLDGLESLAEHSLLVRTDRQWRMPAVVRSFGVGLLDARADAKAIRTEVKDAVLGHGERLAEKMRGPELASATSGLRALAPELERQLGLVRDPDDLVRAYLALRPVLTVRGLDPRRVWQGRVLAAPCSRPLRARVCASVAGAEQGRDRDLDHEDLAWNLCQEAMTLARAEGLDDVFADAAGTGALLRRNCGDYAQAEELLEAGTAAAERSGSPHLRAMMLGESALIAAWQRKPWDDLMLRALRIAAMGDARWAYGTLSGWHANLLQEAGRASEADHAAEIALGIFEEVRDLTRTAWLGLRLVAGWRQQGETARAAAWLDEALRTHLAVASNTYRPLALSHRAALAHEMGELDRAQRLSFKVIEAGQEANLQATEALGHVVLAEVAVERDDTASALAHGRLAQELASSHSSDSIRMMGSLALALAQAWAGEEVTLPEVATGTERVLREQASRLALIAALSGQPGEARRWLDLGRRSLSEREVKVAGDLDAVQDLLEGRRPERDGPGGWIRRLAASAWGG
jgi:tetratricopeptide (TPR) repeat protein